jgi:hypothetical protein
MGCFTSTGDLMREFFQMGISVWQVHSKASASLFEAKLLYTTVPTPPKGLVIDIAPGHNILFDGPNWTSIYIAPMHGWERFHSVDSPQGFELPPLLSSFLLVDNKVDTTLCMVNNLVTTSCPNKKKRKRASKRNAGPNPKLTTVQKVQSVMSTLQGKFAL